MAKKMSEKTANKLMIQNEITRLHEETQAWNEGVYKRSNEQLYSILQDCHLLLIQLRGERKLRKQLDAALEGAGLKTRSNTSLERKVVVAVFGIENNRINAYVSVLQIAKRDLPKGWTLIEWIEEAGGIEEIRRKPKEGPTPAEKARRRCAFAEETLSFTKSIGARFKPNRALQPSEEGTYNFSVALVRVDDDGQASIVFGTNKSSLVKAILTQAGTELEEQETNTETLNKHKKKRKDRDEILLSLDEENAAQEAA